MNRERATTRIVTIRLDPETELALDVLRQEWSNMPNGMQLHLTESCIIRSAIQQQARLVSDERSKRNSDAEHAHCGPNEDQ